MNDQGDQELVSPMSNLSLTEEENSGPVSGSLADQVAGMTSQKPHVNNPEDDEAEQENQDAQPDQ